MKHLLRAWEQVDDWDRSAGQAAYPNYHQALRGWATHYGIGFVQVVEAFVALSPNNDYHGNLRSLSSVLEAASGRTSWDALNITTYRACGDRALAYATGEVSFLDTVKGPKITAFRDNILYPTTSKRVTVDGHMVALWHGAGGVTMKDAAMLLKRTDYAPIERDFQRLASRVGMPPCAAQAALWMSRKRALGIRLNTQADLFTGKSRWDDVPTPRDYPPYFLQPGATFLNKPVDE